MNVLHFFKKSHQNNSKIVHSAASLIFANMFILGTAIWQKIEGWDQWLFKLINSKTANSFFDVLMPFMRNAVMWVPLYLFIVVFALINFRSKGAWWCIFFLCTIALTDMTGNFFKHYFERLRPCADPDFYSQVRLLLKQCAGGYSFTSNHAINHFGMAALFYTSFRNVLGKWVKLCFIWAGIICYAQVYVGVHYPLDVLIGALFGLSIGTLMGQFFNKRFGMPIFDNQSIF